MNVMNILWEMAGISNNGEFVLFNNGHRKTFKVENTIVKSHDV